MYDDSGGEEETLYLIIKEEHGVLVVKRLLVCLLWASLSDSFTCRNLLSNYVDTELFGPILGPTWGEKTPLFSPFSRVFGNNVPAVQPCAS